MRIVEIAPCSNGAHRNQSYNGIIPDGWALLNIETPNFPFGTVEVEEVDGVMTVTAWTAGEIPEPDPHPYEPEPTELERLRADVDYLLMMQEA